MVGSGVALRGGAMGAALIILLFCGPLAVSGAGCGDSCSCPNRDSCMSGAAKTKCDYCSDKCRLRSTYFTDVNNCGSCGHKCTGGTCQGGTCVSSTTTVPTCNTGYANCGASATGCQTNLNSDVKNCKTCSNKCEYANAEATCLQGTCAMGDCKPGYANCDGDSANGCELALTETRMGCDCPAGTAGTDCHVCPKNTASAGGSPSKTSCESCPTGFASNQGADTCNLCAPGYGGSTCTKCSPGTASPGGSPGSTSCELCPGVSIAPNPGASQCAPCPNGLAALADKTACVGLLACDNVDVCNNLVINLPDGKVGTGSGNCICGDYRGGSITSPRNCQANVECVGCQACLKDSDCSAYPNHYCAVSCGGVTVEGGDGLCLPNCGQLPNEFRC